MQSSRRKGYGDERRKKLKGRAEWWKTVRRKVEHEMCPEFVQQFSSAN